MASPRSTSHGDHASTAERLLNRLRDPVTGPQMEVLTSARLLNQLIAGHLIRPAGERCMTHELLLLPSQSGKPTRDSDTEIVSCLCTQCFHHFRIKVVTGSTTPFKKHHAMNMHMFLLDGRDPDIVLQATANKGECVLDRIHLSCIVDDCHCKIEVERLPPRLSMGEVDALSDRGRVARNLKDARARQLDRVEELGNFDVNVFAMLQRYLCDGIESDVNVPPKRIKTHNKKFMVAFKDDFDDLLRTMKCKKILLDDGDEAWVFPVMEPPSSPTKFGTIRAKWEDLEAECMLRSESLGVRKLRPAWDMLQRVIACDDYEKQSTSPPLNEDDMALLGCLPNFKPKLIVEAAKLMSEKAPSRSEYFTNAAGRAIEGRDQDAEAALVQYRSELESRPTPPSQAIIDAFKFFDATPANQAPDYYVGKAFVLLEADGSDVSKRRIMENLELVGKSINSDLTSPFSSTGGDASSGTQMTAYKAQEITGAALDWTQQMVGERINVKAQDSSVNRAEFAEALEFFANHHRPNDAKFADALDEWVGIFKPANQLDSGTTTSGPGQQGIDIDPSTPPGLRNIGNTCYLNSLLQYLYSVTPVRNIVLQFPKNSLDLSPESVAERKLGYGNGIGVTQEEAIIGQQFVEVLQSLFKDLLSTNKVACEPSQKLANTALRSATELLKKAVESKQPEIKPPPLPARPSSTLPEAASSDSNQISVTVEPVSDAMDTASVVSSQTLVNEDNNTQSGILDQPHETIPPSSSVEATAINPEAGFENDTAPEVSLHKKFETIAQLLEKSDRQGTDQQDVEEIIGFILEHLMRAIAPSGSMPGKEDLQADAITNTFFPIVVNYTLKSDESVRNARTEVNPDRWINAFPDVREGASSTLYEALNRSFSLQYVGSDSNLARFSAVQKLSPIIHVRIQRANATSSGATKNSNPVILTDELFLDRYMDVAEGSELDIRRRDDWALQGHTSRLTDIDAGLPRPLASMDKKPFDFDVPTEPRVSEGETDLSGCTLMESEDEAVEKILRQLPLRSKRPEKKRKLNSRASEPEIMTPFIDALNRASNMVGQTTIGDPTAYDRVESFYQTLNQHKYRLHAVICHSGGARAGHYWIWIRDFARNAWIKFNDSTVTVDSRDVQVVINELNKSGDPCYVAYVRDEDKDNVVGIPTRIPIATQADGVAVQTEAIEGVAPDDIDMPDLVSAPVDKHIVTKDGIAETDAAPPYQLL